MLQLHQLGRACLPPQKAARATAYCSKPGGIALGACIYPLHHGLCRAAATAVAAGGLATASTGAAAVVPVAPALANAVNFTRASTGGAGWPLWPLLTLLNWHSECSRLAHE